MIGVWELMMEMVAGRGGWKGGGGRARQRGISGCVRESTKLEQGEGRGRAYGEDGGVDETALDLGVGYTMCD